jgi:hypothetical protein
MPVFLRISRAFLAALAVVLATNAFAEISLPAAADESFGRSPESIKVCLNERVVYRRKAIGSLKAVAAGERIELVRETVCGTLPHSLYDQRLLLEQ